MNYFVITERQALVEAPSFARLIRSRWSAAVVEDVRNPASSHALEFRISMPHGEVTGSLNREGCAVAFIGDLRDCAAFALWCRSWIPSSEPVTFCDESMSASLDLTVSSTLADLVQAFELPVE